MNRQQAILVTVITAALVRYHPRAAVALASSALALYWRDHPLEAEAAWIRSNDGRTLQEFIADPYPPREVARRT